MSKLPIEYLRHIYDECLFITTAITSDMTRDELLENETLKRAIVWDVAKNKIPEIQVVIAQIIETESNK